MSDVLFTLAVVSVLAVLLALRARKDVRTLRNRRNLPIADRTDTREMSESELNTRRLIGDSAYERMVERVDRILKRHDTDRSLNVSLTTGPDTPQGWNQLNSILPGDPLWLKRADHSDVNCVEVFSGGFKIGELMLEDARSVSNILEHNVITGSYVAEQNSYGDSDVASLRLILFFRAERRMEGIEVALDNDASLRVEIPGTGRLFNISQN